MKLTAGMVWAFIGGLAVVAGSGWTAREYVNTNLASKDEVLLAGNKADFVLDQQLAAVQSRIGFLEGKTNKTRTDHDELNYLRKQVEIMRKVKAGK